MRTVDRMVRDERGRFVELDPYACPVYERHGDCACSTGVGFTCSMPTEEPTDG